MFYLYKIENILNGKIYIGKTCNPKRRWTVHKSISKSKKSFSNQFSYIHAAMNKYGLDNFSFSVIGSYVNEQEAYLAEETLISELKINNKEIYNLVPGGLGYKSGSLHPGFGKNRSEETKNKISKTKKGKYTGSLNPNFGNKYSAESKERIRNASIGRKHSDETKLKISKSVKDTDKSLRGEDCPKAKLSNNDVTKIRKMLEDKHKVKEISNIFNVHRNTIYSIKSGKNWRRT